jgi:polysaccharide deacetylase 2 family uncharacterized protein YibQ
MKRNRKRTTSSPANRLTLALLVLGGVAGILLAALFFWPSGSRPVMPPAADHKSPAFLPENGTAYEYSSGSGKPTPSPSAAPEALVKKKASIAIVIDDAGNDLAALDRFLAFPGKLSIAVLPQLPHSRESAQRAHAAGKEVILHLPLEPLGSENPGPGAVLVSFSRDRIRNVLDEDFATVPFAAGVNNHMGSLGTQDRAVMDALMSYLKEKNKYFVDSRTVSSTLGKEYAGRYGVPAAERNIFLDDRPEPGSVLRALNDGAVYARLHGRALLIGHVQNRAVLNALLEQYEGLVSSGIEFVTVSEYLRARGGAEP